MKVIPIILVMIFFTLNTTACKKSNTQSTAEKNHSNITDTALMKVKKMRIFFAHQSVGKNILDGIVSLQDQSNSEQLHIHSTRNANEIDKPGLYHASVGSNYSPESKIKDFKELIESGIGDKIDVAILKFCFIDFNKQTDLTKIFNEYNRVIEELKQKYPQITFVHTTVPLISDNMTLKDWIKKILGRSQKISADNIARNKYNDYLRKFYQDKEPIFDIAKFESTYPDGQTRVFTDNNIQYEAMVPDYTDDGGHLNTFGQKQISINFFEYISEL